MKENQRTTLTKKLLKDSLLQLLKEKELDDINITELCAAAQINRTTFYRYYKFPADVLYDIEEEIINDFRTKIKNIKTSDDAKLFLKNVCEECNDKSSILGYFLHYNPKASQALFLSDFYKRGGKGLIEDDDGDASRVMGIYFAGGAYFILRTWVEGGLDYTTDEMAEVLWKLMTGDYSRIIGKP